MAADRAAALARPETKAATHEMSHTVAGNLPG